MKTKVLTISMVIVVVLFSSCVPMKQYSELKHSSDKCLVGSERLKEENRELIVDRNELEGKQLQQTKKIKDLSKQVDELIAQNDDLEVENQRLKKLKEDYEKQINTLKEGSSEEISELLTELQKLQEDLQEREDRVRIAEQLLKQKQEELRNAQNQLAEQQQELENQQQQLSDAEKELASKEAKLFELQDALDKQKNAVSELKNKLYSALKGFYDQGLSVYEKNGKVYVSMDEKLLFRTGSYNLGEQGQQALTKLAEVLAANKGVNVMIEGHTDNVPLNGSGIIKDNWDLSVMRATAVTRILLQNTSVEPHRIIASGRSEYVPLEAVDTPESRKKNRRTEIILTPDLNKILEILESN